MATTTQVYLPETSLWANRKCLLICAVVAMANMQYGLDSAVVGSLQAMPGFLKVFGHADPSAPGGYAIGVSDSSPACKSCWTSLPGGVEDV